MTFSLHEGGVVMSSQIMHTQSPNTHPLDHILDICGIVKLKNKLSNTFDWRFKIMYKEKNKIIKYWHFYLSNLRGWWIICLSSYLLRQSLCLISFLLFPCASVLENTHA